MNASRQTPAQRAPTGPLAGFPVRRVASGTVLHRAHQARRGPWWFSSEGGRFDLVAPRGTCYLATSALAAVRERLGPVLAQRISLPASVLEGVVVSRLRVGSPGRRGALRLANLRAAGAADFGVTRELESMTPYDVPVQWAHAFDRSGHDGVWYGPRFSPGPASAVAVFGAHGPDGSRSVDDDPVPATQVRGVARALELPRRRDLKVIEPPRGRVSRSR